MALKLLLIVTFMLLCTNAAMAFTDGLLPNGNFEQAPSPSKLHGTRLLGHDAIPSWHTSGFVEYIRSGQTQNDMLLPVPEGAAAVRLGNEASIKQRLRVVPGKRYALTFSAARTCAMDERLNISAGSAASDVIPMQTMYSSNGWDSYAWAWTAAVNSSTSSITLHNVGITDDPACGPLIDAVAVKFLPLRRKPLDTLLKNGDFEEGPYIFPNTSWGVLVPPHVQDARSPLPGWVVMSMKAVKYIDSEHFSVPSGRRAVELVGGKESAVMQVVRTAVGREYVLSFSVGDARNMCEDSMEVEASAGKASVKVKHVSKGTGWSEKAVLRFRAEAERTRVVFMSSFYHRRRDDMSSLCGPVVDDVKLVSVRRS